MIIEMMQVASSNRAEHGGNGVDPFKLVTKVFQLLLSFLRNLFNMLGELKPDLLCNQTDEGHTGLDRNQQIDGRALLVLSNSLSGGVAENVEDCARINANNR